jgi:hypothetical protein
VKLTRRQLVRFHDAAIAVVALLESDDLVVELSVHAHILLLSLVEALEFGSEPLVREVADCLPDAWRSRLPEMARAIAQTLRNAGAGRAGGPALQTSGGAS